MFYHAIHVIIKKSALVNGGDLLKKANTHNQHMTYDKHIESYSDATWIVFLFQNLSVFV